MPNDAEAVCTAVVQPNMRWVALKSVEQQALLSLHRVRQGLLEERTGDHQPACAAYWRSSGSCCRNRCHGCSVRCRRCWPTRSVCRYWCSAACRCCASILHELELRVGEFDRAIAPACQEQCAGAAPGGTHGHWPALPASAAVATVGNAHDYRNGRQFRRLARTGAAAIFQWRQDQARTHHPPWRCLFCETLLIQGRAVSVGKQHCGEPRHVAIGSVAWIVQLAQARRLSQDSGRHCQQARPHHLGPCSRATRRSIAPAWSAHKSSSRVTLPNHCGGLRACGKQVRPARRKTWLTLAAEVLTDERMRAPRAVMHDGPSKSMLNQAGYRDAVCSSLPTAQPC